MVTLDAYQYLKANSKKYEKELAAKQLTQNDIAIDMDATMVQLDDQKDKVLD